jgi:hypothetical protein
MSWVMPTSLPGFQRHRAPSALAQLDHESRFFRRGKLTVALTVDDYETGEPGQGVWAHCSLARPDRDPTWGEIKEVRDLVFGRESTVVQVLAPASCWLNVHEHCFHLWMRLDAPTVPEALYDQIGADGSTYGKRAPLPEVRP